MFNEEKNFDDELFKKRLVICTVNNDMAHLRCSSHWTHLSWRYFIGQTGLNPIKGI